MKTKLIAFAFIAIICVILALPSSSSLQLKGLIIAGALLLYFLMYQNNEDDLLAGRLYETDFDNLLEVQYKNDSILTDNLACIEPYESFYADGPVTTDQTATDNAKDTTTEPVNDDTTKETKDTSTDKPDKPVEVSTGVESVDCLCNFDGDMNDYGSFKGDIDDVYALYSRRKFVHTKAKGPDRDMWRQVLEPEVTVQEKRQWWGNDED